MIGVQGQQGVSAVYASPQQPQQVGIDVNGDGRPDIMVPVGAQPQYVVYQQQAATVPIVSPQVQISNQSPYSQSQPVYANPYAQSQHQQQAQVYGSSQYAQQPPQQVQMSVQSNKKNGKDDTDDHSAGCACCACLMVIPCFAALGALLGSMFGGDIAEALGDAADAIGDAIT
ncbi:hypothetical protein Pmar_PMAR014647 [Perkinsus marinus ATCC 50983]|uniref:Uncharacterized protein n=1 Tax=Perkinsus marinus (strain ATCC 50983 / TXsc) TaxID=423536 RepID=C5LIM8_PERM5|nr:hypothetical protein Pmar_PMAR014647 [Perkinsus marinus ATCC 50983]EER03431.1 hypothetical protein Pmar_PMAR014647 [Perkinsus marinus ATCC 50983]|eukprot:XP_002771615.1 hypothetical protein Pmar_PMAR014647 [Perkinsus marinus ATCC 50983]